MVLTAEQQAAIEQGQPVSVIVGTTPCVIVREDVYQGIEAMLDDWDPRLMRRHLASMMAEDWGDPAMEIYDQ
ncbi:MAG: hypothetical protein KY476_12830 [Planctomycetes bacterium]|nr:hypothetical protein [Planctomycetota bacterium]